MKRFFMIITKRMFQSFSVVVMLGSIIACSEKPAPVVEVPTPTDARARALEAVPAPVAVAPAPDVASEVSNSRHAKKYKEHYTSPSIESTDPVGSLSSSETYSLCSEGCSAMSNGSSSTYADCVRACTNE